MKVEGGFNLSITYSIVDVETTGLFPNRSDRIIEIAIINMDSEGKIKNEYETLVNPGRDLGPTNIHKITASMIKNAPIFNDIAGDVLGLLAGSIIVGHNVSFDYNFLDCEFKRINTILPEPSCICTLNLVRKVDSSIPSGKLGCVCEYFNIPIENQHCAYSDCLSTAQLFKLLLQEYGAENVLRAISKPAEKEQWPKLPCKNIMYKRDHYLNLKDENNYIANLLGRLPILGDCQNDGEIEYLNLLDEILADRLISQNESQCLFEIAVGYGISRDKSLSLHKTYFMNLVRVALLDKIITDVEMRDLIQVSKLLNISEEDVKKSIIEGQKIANGSKILQNKKDLTGKSVCFTGTLNSCFEGIPITRETAQKIAIEHGLIVKNGVTKELDYLVVADPETMSGKAKKAREYKTVILAEQTFWNMLGIQVS
jgi:DNA polymerase-3 subunit epsilon